MVILALMERALVSQTGLLEKKLALAQLQSLYYVGQQLSASLNVAEVMNKAVTHLTQLTHAHSSTIWGLADKVLRLEASYGQQMDLQNLPLKPESLIAEVVRLQEAQFIRFDEATAVDHSFLQNSHAHYSLAVPLVIQDVLIGLATLHSNDERLADDLDLAKAITQQAAIAIQNAQLFEELQELNQNLERRIAARTHELAEEKERQEKIYQITGRLTRTLDLDQLINQTLQQLADVVDATNGIVMLNEDSYSNDLSPEAVVEYDEGQRPSEEANEQLSLWAMSQRQAMLISDFYQDERWNATFKHVRSVLAAPITADRDAHGILLLTDPRPNQFSNTQLRMAEAVAVQLAASINNARLHDYVRDQVLRLGEMLHQQEVEDSQKEAILASITDGVVATDRNAHILLINPAAETILNQSEADLIGQPVEQIFDIFESDGRYKVLETFSSLERLRDQGETDFGETAEVILESKRHIIGAKMTLARTSQEFLGVVIVLRDITKEVEADRSKTEFISTVSHELRTPMTSIKGYADFLAQGAVGPMEERQKHFLEVIRRNADRLSLLINDLLDISRIEAGKVRLDLRETQMSQLVEHVVESMMITTQSKGLTLTLSANADLPSVMADWDRLTQVMTNLLGNAINYTESGQVHVSLKLEGDKVWTNIQDTGIGIPSEVLPHIFDRCYRAEDSAVQSSSGTGLGLSIVRAIVEMHGGELLVESEPGIGSTFTFALPVLKTAA
jgi:PAS domain S-box-containing protein